MVIVIGADVHKATHTFVAVDDVGRKISEKTVRATTKGHGAALWWARCELGGDELQWAIEDCRHLSARLEKDLLAAGQDVVRVPPKLMAQSRSSARERGGKSDPIDALAVARAALREPDLPVASHDERTRELKLLVDPREDLVSERTRQINRLRWHLHELDPPEFSIPVKGLKVRKQRRRVADWLAGRDGLVAELARDILTDIDTGSVRIDDLEKRITVLVEDRYPHLLAIPPVAPR